MKNNVSGISQKLFKTVYFDESMKRFEMMLPAAGSSSSCVRLTIEELERSCPGAEWVDVCKY